jgi:hypothetical protein
MWLVGGVVAKGVFERVLPNQPGVTHGKLSHILLQSSTVPAVVGRRTLLFTNTCGLHFKISQCDKIQSSMEERIKASLEKSIWRATVLFKLSRTRMENCDC